MTPEAFIDMLKADALAYAARSKLPAAALIAVACLETGWGRRICRQADRDSKNLFNIKGVGPAGAVTVTTREWYGKATWARLQRQGVAFRLTGAQRGDKLEGLLEDRFRAYHSYQESFEDFVRLLTEKPRYKPVLAAKDAFAFCAELQRCGYATDPSYAEKLHSILRVRVMPRLAGK